MTNITLPKEFLSAVKIQKSQHEALKGIFFECEDGVTNIVATDTKTLKRYVLNSSSNDNCTQLICPEWLKAYIKGNKIRAKGGVYGGINVMQEVIGYEGDKHINARYAAYKNIIPDNFVDILNITKEQLELLRAKENLKTFMMVLCYIEAESKKAKFALVDTTSNLKKDMFEVDILVEPVNFDRNIFLSFDLFTWVTCESETITMRCDAKSNDMCETHITLKNGNDLVISCPYLKYLTYKDFKSIDMDSDSCKIIAEVAEAMDIYDEQAFVKLSDGGYCFVCGNTNKAIKLNGITPDIVLQTLNKESWFKKTEGGNFIKDDSKDSILCKGIYHIASIKLGTSERAFINSIGNYSRNFLYINDAKVAYLGAYGFAELNNRAFINTSCQKICLSCDFTLGNTIDVYAIDSSYYVIFTSNRFYIVSNKFSEMDYAKEYEKFIARNYSKIDIASTKEYIAKNAAMTKESCVAKLLDNCTHAFIDDDTSRIVRLLISGDYFYFLIKEPLTFGFSKGDSKNNNGNIASNASESESVKPETSEEVVASCEADSQAPENCIQHSDSDIVKGYETLESLNEIDLNDSEAYSKIFNLYHSVQKQEWYFGKNIVLAIIKSVLLNNFYNRCSNMTPCVNMPELTIALKIGNDSLIAGHYKSIEAIQTYYVFNELKVGANSNNKYIRAYYAIVNAILDYKDGKATPIQATLLELLAMQTPQNNTSRIKTYREEIIEAWDTFIKKRFNSEKLEFVESLVGNRIEWAGDYCAHIKSYKGDLVAVVELDSDNNVVDLDIRIPIKKYYEHITSEQVELLYRLMELEYKTKKLREEAVNL